MARKLVFGNNWRMVEKQIRMFIAIPLPTEVRAVLEQVSAALDQPLPPRAVRWVKPDLMHVTLRFLGDTAVSLIPTIITGLDRICAQQQAFYLVVGGLGCFPNRKRPRVIWTGLQGDLAQVRALAVAVETAVSATFDFGTSQRQPQITGDGLGNVD